MNEKMLIIGKVDNALALLSEVKEFLEPESIAPIVVIVDAGHGGNHPETGEYMTPNHIGKKYRFTSGAGRGLEIREGVINRQIAGKFCDALEKEGIEFVKIYHEHHDYPLSRRVEHANNVHARAQREGKLAVVMSFHSNAYGMNQSGAGESPRGWCVFTSPGHTDADQLARAWFLNTRESVGGLISFRLDDSDGDPDFEENFYMLRATTAPAALVENLFFTNYQDARLLMSEQYQEASAQAALEAVKDYARAKNMVGTTKKPL